MELRLSLLMKINLALLVECVESSSSRKKVVMGHFKLLNDTNGSVDDVFV